MEFISLYIILMMDLVFLSVSTLNNIDVYNSEDSLRNTLYEISRNFVIDFDGPKVLPLAISSQSTA